MAQIIPDIYLFFFLKANHQFPYKMQSVWKIFLSTLSRIFNYTFSHKQSKTECQRCVSYKKTEEGSCTKENKSAYLEEFKNIEKVSSMYMDS